MNLSEIISIGGKPGLYKIVGHIKNGVLVESLIDKKRFPAQATHQVSELDNITMYTDEEDIALADVLQKIFDAEDGKEAISHKSSSDELKAYFKKVVPNYDQDRVYVSDIKKVISWYNLLQKEGLLVPSPEEKKEKSAPKKAKAVKKTAKPKAAKKAPLKTSSAKTKVQTVRKTGA